VHRDGEKAFMWRDQTSYSGINSIF
jgi:hypothetical protein